MKYKYIRRSILLSKIDKLKAAESELHKKRIAEAKRKDAVLTKGDPQHERRYEDEEIGRHYELMNRAQQIERFITEAPTEEGERGKWVNKKNLIGTLDAKYSELAGMSGSFYSGFQYAVSLIKLFPEESGILIKPNLKEGEKK